MKKIILAAIATLSLATTASADTICDTKRSFWTGLTTGVLGTSTATGVFGKALGYYPIKNGITGAYMLGSTAVGKSGAGTVGIIAGTSGILGSAAAILLSTPVLIGGAVIAGGIGALETYCYFRGGGIQERVNMPEV